MAEHGVEKMASRFDHGPSTPFGEWTTQGRWSMHKAGWDHLVARSSADMCED